MATNRSSKQSPKTRPRVRHDDKRSNQLLKTRVAAAKKKEPFPEHLENVGSVALGRKVIAGRGKTPKAR